MKQEYRTRKDSDGMLDASAQKMGKDESMAESLTQCPVAIAPGSEFIVPSNPTLGAKPLESQGQATQTPIHLLKLAHLEFNRTITEVRQRRREFRETLCD